MEYEKSLITLYKVSDMLAVPESGGLGSVSGHAVIVTGPQGEKKTALALASTGQKAHATQAWIPVGTDDHVIEVHDSRNDRLILVHHLLGSADYGFITIAWHTEIVGRYEGSPTEGTWTVRPPDYLQPAIDVAITKATTPTSDDPVWCNPPMQLAS